MPGNLTFQINLSVVNGELPGELAARVKDLRVVFEDIIEDWVGTNEDKFARSIGMESSGVEIDPGLFWKELAASTMKAKRSAGIADQIMVETGELENTMSNPELIFRYADEDKAIFGTPMSQTELDKVKFNWQARQVIFLSLGDQDMIRKKVQDYFQLGGDYKRIMFSKGLQNVREEARMNAEFEDITGDFSE